MKTKSFLFSLAFFLSIFVYGQQSGNAVYGQTYNQTYSKDPSSGKLFLTDSTFIIEGSVVMNVIADGYVATFGVAEESTTLKDCNDKIEKRIGSFTADLLKLGVLQTDIYIDMTTQNKIYDYKLTGNVSEQYLKGFELKKNVIVKFKNIKDLDAMVIAASNYQIYDLVKVDYEVADINKIYLQLFQSAMDVINEKKGLYVTATNAKLLTSSEIYLEDFRTYFPNQLYKSYTAYSSSEVYDYDRTRKEVRKSPTYYYDRMNYSGFDKIINPTVTEPAVEFTLTLQIKYQIAKEKK